MEQDQQRARTKAEAEKFNSVVGRERGRPVQSFLREHEMTVSGKALDK